MALFTIFPVTGTSIYMDPVNGNNNNAGTAVAPVKNFGAAWAKLPSTGGNIITAAGRVTESLNYSSKPVNWYADGYVEVDGQAGSANYAGLSLTGFNSLTGFHFKNYKSNNLLLTDVFTKAFTNCTFSHCTLKTAVVIFDKCLFQDCHFEVTDSSSPSTGNINYCTFIKTTGIIGGSWRTGNSVTNCIFMNCPNLKFGGANSSRPSFLQSTDANSAFDFNVYATLTADAAGTEIVLAGKTFAGLQADAVLLKSPNSLKCPYTDVFTGVVTPAPSATDAWKNSYSLIPSSPVLFKSADRIHPGARNVGYRFDAAYINDPLNHDYLAGLTLTPDPVNPANEAKYLMLANGATAGTAVFSGSFGNTRMFDVARFCADLVWDDLNADSLYDEELDMSAVTGAVAGSRYSFDFYLEYGTSSLPAWDQNSGDNSLNLADFISRAKLVEWQKPVRIDAAGKGNAEAGYAVNNPLVVEASHFRIGFKIRRN